MIPVSLFLLHLGSTLFMMGVIWIIQCVHYPLFNRVDPEQFIAFESSHSDWITWVVLPPMVIQLLSALILLWSPSSFLPHWAIWVGATLTVGTWVSTFVLSVPQHQRLATGFNTEAHRQLVQTNWVRTGCWTLHSFVLLYCLGDLLLAVQYKI